MIDPAVPVNLDRFPLTPARLAPPDPLVSETSALSNCVWDDDWPSLALGSCMPGPRPAGSRVGQVAIDDTPDDFSISVHFALVFSDDRDGVQQIYFKATDGFVAFPSLGSAEFACGAGGRPEAELSFPLLRECAASVTERIERYIVYYGSEETDGTTATGPFPKRVTLARAGLFDPATLTISGLNPDETYHFVLLAEDEARNLSPAAFDPRTAENVLQPKQVFSGVTPPCDGGCVVPDLSRVAELKAVKDGLGGIDFVWNPDPPAGEYHLNAVGSKQLAVEPSAHRAPVGEASEVCTVPSTSCSESDAFDGTSLYYQVASACDAGGLGEGPL